MLNGNIYLSMEIVKNPCDIEVHNYFVHKTRACLERLSDWLEATEEIPIKDLRSKHSIGLINAFDVNILGWFNSLSLTSAFSSRCTIVIIVSVRRYDLRQLICHTCLVFRCTRIR